MMRFRLLLRLAGTIAVLLLFAFSWAVAEPGSGKRMPELKGATAWINSPALKPADLRGKVVLVDFWTYSCINCLRTLPAMRAWQERYKSQGLVIVGVHTPEFPFEGEPAKVERAVRRFGLEYPVAVDANHAIWDAFNNRYWPAHYLVDASGHIRFQHFGERGEAEETREIELLLAERNSRPAQSPASLRMSGSAIEQPADFDQVRSPETYIGSERAERFASPGPADGSVPRGGLERFGTHLYGSPGRLLLNQWALTGLWQDAGQSALLRSGSGSILFRFHARDLHLVLGPGRAKKPLRFQVLIDGHAPGAAHGADTDAGGYGQVNEERLYQLVRQPGQVQDHTFEIRFLDGGVEAFSFTFG